jgi:CheY-like chemotaxis protein
MGKLKNILLIDDDYMSNMLTATEIKKSDLAEHVEIAHHGEEGLNKLKSRKRNIHFELILLDFNMPVMDGFEFLQKFNELDLHPKPKVVVLTSSHDPKEIARANEFNITGFINKPFYASKLNPILQNLS